MSRGFGIVQREILLVLCEQLIPVAPAVDRDEWISLVELRDGYLSPDIDPSSARRAIRTLAKAGHVETTGGLVGTRYTVTDERWVVTVRQGVFLRMPHARLDRVLAETMQHTEMWEHFEGLEVALHEWWILLASEAFELVPFVELHAFVEPTLLSVTKRADYHILALHDLDHECPDFAWPLTFARYLAHQQAERRLAHEEAVRQGREGPRIVRRRETDDVWLAD